MGAAIVNMNHFGEGLMQKLDNPNGTVDRRDLTETNNAFELNPV